MTGSENKTLNIGDSIHTKSSFRYNFAPDDLDALLYGFIRVDPAKDAPVHSMSGIRFGSFTSMNENNGNSMLSQRYSYWPPVSLVLPTEQQYPDFPSSLCLRQLRLGNLFHKGVFSHKEIKAGTRFGPYLGVEVCLKEAKLRNHQFSWEIFEGSDVTGFIDGYYKEKNWLKNINCARYCDEQNLNIVQVGKNIYYQATKDIQPGTELLVWYGDDYELYLNLPMAIIKVEAETKQIETRNDQDVNEAFPCERCGKVFAYKYYRDKHLKFTKCVDQGNRKFPCEQCPRSFEKRDRLRIHVLHVHERHRPHECNICGKKFSQSSSLNKHQRVHSGERPYKCSECNKAFTASSILRTHLRQHSGERPFKCVHCGKAFASHAAHDSHVRRTHNTQKLCVCETCGKAFSQAYELKFHMNIHTGNKPYSCDRCGRCFSSPSSRDRHRLHYSCAKKGQKNIEKDDKVNNNT